MNFVLLLLQMEETGQYVELYIRNDNYMNRIPTGMRFVKLLGEADLPKWRPALPLDYQP